jgi:trk system potassium uptake protein TrkH
VHLFSPNQVVPQYYNKRRLSDEVSMSVIAFLALYVGTVGFVTLILTTLGLDFMTSISAAATAMGNVGPGIGEIIGPAGTFSSLPIVAKWVLSFTMMFGRLEIFTVFVVLHPDFWRR